MRSSDLYLRTITISSVKKTQKSVGEYCSCLGRGDKGKNKGAEEGLDLRYILEKECSEFINGVGMLGMKREEMRMTLKL